VKILDVARRLVTGGNFSNPATKVPAPTSLQARSPAKQPRFIAFYLPQFHPIPENDQWWGRGFTEWRNVTRAVPLFSRHHQPQIPADLGFYDLRLVESRIAQAELAKAHGVDGFCYWHYWFNGRRLLERPFNEVLKSGQPDFPFCLAWANEPWARNWLGRNQDVLAAQSYSKADDKRHSAWLADAFADGRYLRVGGQPVFLVYHPAHHPNIDRFTSQLRDTVAARGLGNPYLIAINSHSSSDFRPFGFDANLKFEPQLGALPGALDDTLAPETFMEANRTLGLEECGLRIYDYRRARDMMQQFATPRPAIPCVLVGFDNSPRRGQKGIILINNSPEAFADALETAVRANIVEMPENELTFINAWNEWAEGNHLEPDIVNGLGHLEALLQVKSRFTKVAGRRGKVDGEVGVQGIGRVD
jgi:Glycosyltransferase WbsX